MSPCSCAPVLLAAAVGALINTSSVTGFRPHVKRLRTMTAASSISTVMLEIYELDILTNCSSYSFNELRWNNAKQWASPVKSSATLIEPSQNENVSTGRIAGPIELSIVPSGKRWSGHGDPGPVVLIWPTLPVGFVKQDCCCCRNIQTISKPQHWNSDACRTV